jgi:hypothetical protein
VIAAQGVQEGIDKPRDLAMFVRGFLLPSPGLGQMLCNQDGCNAAGVLTSSFVQGTGFGTPGGA